MLRIGISLRLLITACLALSLPCSAKELPLDLTPAQLAEALQAHLDAEVLPYWVDAARLTDEPRWEASVGVPIIRQLRLIYDHAVAIQRQDDTAERTRIRAQYDALCEDLADRYRDTDGLWRTAIGFTDDWEDTSARETVCQAYVIYVLADTAHRISDSRAREWAIESFEALDARAHDAEHGGYLERADLPASDDANSAKQLGTAMHVALALSALHRIAPTGHTRERLTEQCDLLVAHTLDAGSGNAYMAFARDWFPIIDQDNPTQQTLYGHNAELVWYVLRARQILGDDVTDLLPWARAVAEGVIANGMGEDGRVFTWGPMAGECADKDNVRWWSQVEGMMMLATMVELTGESRYFDLLGRTTTFAFRWFAPDGVGAWKSDANPATGETADGLGESWKAGLHTIRALLEVPQALRDAEAFGPLPRPQPRAVVPRRAVQLEPRFGYFANRSAESIAREVAANGFDCVHLFCWGDEIVPEGLVEACHDLGIEVWGTFFPSGVYMSAAVFPPEHEEWRIRFTDDTVFGGYRFFSYIHPGLAEWWKTYLTGFFERHNLDGMLWYEVHYPTQKGATAYTGKPVFSDVSEAFEQAFVRATGHAQAPEFIDEADPHHYLTDDRLYRDWVEFRITSLVDFQREVLDGEGGFRRAHPTVPFATWTITLSYDDGLAIMRENEAQDPARFVVEVRPQAHFMQTHAPDWSNVDMAPDYARRYQPCIDAVRAVRPGLPTGFQADVGSTLPWRRDPDWMAAMEAGCRELGVDVTTYYEFSLRWEVYFAPPVAVDSFTEGATATIVFDQPIDPASCEGLVGRELDTGARVEALEVDGCLLRLTLDRDAAGATVPLEGIADDPTIRYPLVGRPEEERLGPQNRVEAGVAPTEIRF